jgi:Domain of unknown function (DUF5916)/Carbohydrate family 9 binding domain-like
LHARTGLPTPLALALFCATPALAQTPSGSIPSMEAHRIDTEMIVDGRLDEAVWSSYPAATHFVQREPVEGAPALNDSEVWLLYDDDALYVGAVVHDETPETVMRNMARRDAIALGQFDYFEVMLDPNLDGRTGYRFRVTAANVQTDRYLYDDSKEDAAWDAVWTSGVRMDPRGWTVEMRIPLSQIRYETSDGPQTWGVNWGRRRIADNELTRFRLESKLVRGRVSQFGRVTGITLTRSPRRVEIRPYVVSTARRGPGDSSNPFFDGSETSARAGFDLRYGLGSAFTLDATINPDFGQVEADPAVVNLTAFETFFQERRPFFVEDARIFDFSLSGRTNSLFYTRRVGRAPSGRAPAASTFSEVPEASTILGAAKLTGRTAGGLSVGAMAALTDQEEGSAVFEDGGDISRFVVEPRTAFGVVRIEQDFREGSSNVGGIVTALGRSLPRDGAFDDLSTSTFTAGVDFEHNWKDRTYALWGFYAGSHVRGSKEAMTRVLRNSNHYRQRPDLAWAEYDTTATHLTGAEWRLQFEKRRGRWQAGLWAAEVTPDFEINDLGFSTSQERLDGGASLQYQQVVPRSIFRNYTFRLTTFHNFSHEVLTDIGSLDRWNFARTAGTVSANANLTFRNFWNLTTNVAYAPERVSRRMTRGGPRMVNPAERSLRVSFRNDNRSLIWIRSSLNLTHRYRGSGSRTRATVGLSIQPSARLRLSVDPTFTRETDGTQYVSTTTALPFQPTFGSRYIFADLERRSLSVVTRANYTFTPKLTFELFGQALLSAGDYVRYKQLATAGTFDFDIFSEGAYLETDGAASCGGGRSCESPSNRRYVDFDNDGAPDYSFGDRDFNVRSFRATAVIRWEYRPGSTLFLVWQRRQAAISPFGDFDFSRDAGALFDAPADDRFILKVNLWLSG